MSTKRAAKKKATKRVRPATYLDVDECVPILAALSSENDPIWSGLVPCHCCGHLPEEPTETTPRGLEEQFPGDGEQFHTIEFISVGGQRVKGTLRDMIIDRLK